MTFQESIGFPVRLNDVPGFTDDHITRALAAAKNPQLKSKLENMPVALSADLVDEYMGPVLRAAQTGELSLIRYSQRSVIGQQIERYLRHIGVQAPHRYAFDATDPLLSLVASGLGWALSTPLCLWQSRQYLDAVTVVPLPPTRLAQRHFFLLSRENEWAGLDADIARIARAVIRHDTAPTIRRSLPGLPEDAISCPDEELP